MASARAWACSSLFFWLAATSASFLATYSPGRSSIATGTRLATGFLMAPLGFLGTGLAGLLALPFSLDGVALFFEDGAGSPSESLSSLLGD